MMSNKLAKDNERFYMNQIRRLFVVNGHHNMTGKEVHETLQSNGLVVSYNRVCQLMRKIEKQRAHTRLNYTLGTYLQNFIDTMSEADRRLWGIVTSPKAKNGEKIYAISEIRKNRQAVFDKLFEAGVFEKQLGNLNLQTFMDIVKSTPVHDSTATVTGIRPGPRTLEEESRGGDYGDMGARLIDMVRAATDSPSTTEPPQDSNS